MDTSQNTPGDDFKMVEIGKPAPGVNESPGQSIQSQGGWRRHRWVKILGAVFFLLLLLVGVGGWQVWAVYQEGVKIVPVVAKAQGNLQSQDLPALKETLVELHEQVGKTQGLYERLGWVRIIPLVSSYWRDGDHAATASVAGIEAAQILVEAIEPYADVLGFKGSGSFTGGTAEDRIITILQTLDKITPKLDDVAGKLKVVDENLSAIDEKRYQVDVKEKHVAEELGQIKEAVHGLAAAVTDAKPALESLPKLAGMEEERKYMVLFHNDGELRGTGGFMTAYGILRVEKGRVAAERSSDIYDLDSRFRERLQPPEAIKKYLKNVPYWHLRDMNLSADFKQNMDLFTSYYQKIPGEPRIDGVIGVDTNFLVDLLKILGPIDVPGFGRFTADNDERCDCPQVVYQLELIADRPVASLVENRKGVLGPLMRELIVRAYGAPKPWWDDLFKTVVGNAQAKHLVFYFFDDQFQQAAEQLEVAGRVTPADGDYLLITDVNFSGAKANFFVTQSVEQRLSIGPDGEISKTLTVTYTNSSPPSNCNLEAGQLCLNAVMPNYVRVYLPKGSQLVEVVGLDEKLGTREEQGMTVVEGFLKISPQATTKTSYTYRLPWKSSEAPTTFFIQQQVGKDVSHYRLELPDRVEEFDLVGDKRLRLEW